MDAIPILIVDDASCFATASVRPSKGSDNDSCVGQPFDNNLARHDSRPLSS